MTAATTVIDLPNPTLVVIIGIQGSGKTTLARRHFAPIEILSSDEFRARLCNDPASQSNTRPALEQLIATLHQRLINKVTTVVDATNIQPERRAVLLDAARRHGVPVVAILLDIPVERCRERISTRARTIRDEVLDEQAAQWPQVVRDVAHEGYTAVHIVNDHQVPTVRFRHALPTALDPGRWVDVDQIDAAGRTFRFPADEIRRHPNVLTARDPGAFAYACTAADRASLELPATNATTAEPKVGTMLRVQLPHCQPIYLIREPSGWCRTGPVTR